MVFSLEQRSSPILEQVLSQLKEVRTSLRGWKACCPAHADRTPSLSIGLGEHGQVLLKCFAGCSLERIVEAMGLTMTDLFPDTPSGPGGQATTSGNTHHLTLTLVDLAMEKQLPWQFLFHLGVMEHPSGGLCIPYHLADGSLAPRHRIRTALVAKEGSYWSTGTGAIVPYGLARLEEARKAGYLVLVEGESDCWTLWYQGFQALGLPGAEMIRTLEASMLTGIDRVYIMQEPDAGGTSFVNQITRKLEAWQWQGKAFMLRLPGAKDPNEWYQQDRQGFRTAFQQALEQAEPLSYPNSPSSQVPPQQGQPTIFSLPDLLSWTLPPVCWTIPEMLPEGLTLLAGKPKLGKSWLALSVALSIAAGGMALGTQPVKQGDVLYLALEDNARRLQARAMRLLETMTGTPDNLDFALDWPRLSEGGLAYLEEYCKAHPHLRLVVIDTWARIAPSSGERRCSQYEGDYEALMPLKRLADTYHVSILAVHHLRKTASSDVLDEIIGSTGVTGAVDGTMILKRDRGQHEAMLFVTGRDIEREQQLALSFDATSALWTLVGNAEELRCTRARQEMLDLLREQGPDGMSAREIAEALQKNYHTTRSLLRKMEEVGEVRRSNGLYLVVSSDTDHSQWQPSESMDQQIQEEQRGSICRVAVDGMDGGVFHMSNDEHDYSDYSDYGDDADDISKGSITKGRIHSQVCDVNPVQQSISKREDLAVRQQEQVVADMHCHGCNHRHHRNHGNHIHQPTAPEKVQGENTQWTDNTRQKEQPDAFLQRQRCPHHPQAHLVRFDPSGQAWCDKLECWDCYRLMKIGEALEYRCLTDLTGKLMIDQGMAAWSAFAWSQRAFMIVIATEQAIAMCQTLEIEVPDLSGEVKRLVEIRSAPS
jgi:DNA-binding CsgD family transcriptional regulator